MIAFVPQSDADACIEALHAAGMMSAAIIGQSFPSGEKQSGPSTLSIHYNFFRSEDAPKMYIRIKSIQEDPSSSTTIQ